MFARLKTTTRWLKEKAATACATIFCHRAAHGALAMLYGAASAGAPKEVVGYAIASCYAVMFVRG
jgi:hypothetical protein